MISWRKLVVLLMGLIINGICFFPAFAETLKPSEIDIINSILTAKGNEAADAVDFYQALPDCYNKKLFFIKFIRDANLTQLIFDDSSGTCYYATFYFGPEGANDLAGGLCVIDEDQYKKIYTPFFLEAIKDSVKINLPSMGFIKFVKTINACVKPASAADVIAKLQS